MCLHTCICGGTGRVPISTGSPALLTSMSLLKLSACLRYSRAVSVCPCCLAASAAACNIVTHRGHKGHKSGDGSP